MRVDLGVEWTLNRPVMWQIQLAPGSIGKPRLFRAGRVRFQKPPVIVKRKPALAADTHIGAKRTGGRDNKRKKKSTKRHADLVDQYEPITVHVGRAGSVKPVGETMRYFVVVLMAALCATAQENDERVFRYTGGESVRDMQEIATVIRSVSDIRDVSVDTTLRTLTVRPAGAPMGAVEWVFQQLDRPGESPEHREYHIPYGAENVVRVFYPLHARTVQDLNEMATTVRAIGDIRRVFTYNKVPGGAIVLRGTPGQAAMAEWMIAQLDQTQPPRPSMSEYRMPEGGAENIVRIYFLAHAETPERLQEIAVEVRTGAMIRRAFLYNALRAIALRGTAEQLDMANRMIEERDK